jgi:hypothetical protein
MEPGRLAIYLLATLLCLGVLLFLPAGTVA